MAQTIAGDGQGAILECSYDATGKASVTVTDTPIVSWVVNETAPDNPQPVVIGSLPAAAPNTAPIISPRWAYWQAIGQGGIVYVPDGWQGSFDNFLTWLATNNGASRIVHGNFAKPGLFNEWNAWASKNWQLAG